MTTPRAEQLPPCSPQCRADLTRAVGGAGCVCAAHRPHPSQPRRPFPGGCVSLSGSDVCPPAPWGVTHQLLAEVRCSNDELAFLGATWAMILRLAPLGMFAEGLLCCLSRAALGCLRQAVVQPCAVVAACLSGPWFQQQRAVCVLSLHLSIALPCRVCARWSPGAKTFRLFIVSNPAGITGYGMSASHARSCHTLSFLQGSRDPAHHGRCCCATACHGCILSYCCGAVCCLFASQ